MVALLAGVGSTLDYGMDAADPLIIAAVVAALTLAALLACAAPLHRATRVDPIGTLRQDG
jgi:ABC-type lipoprotein release transport system permease subunit